MTRVAVLSGVAIAIAGCQAGPRTIEQATSPAGDTVAVVGVVRVVGADPLTQLVVQREGGEATAIVGPLLTELHQTVGLEVRIVGVTADAVPPVRHALSVHAYEALALNGAPVHTGLLQQAGDALYLMGAKERWMLVNPPEGLRAALGAKVWVAGEASDGALPVFAYGILKRAS